VCGGDAAAAPPPIAPGCGALAASGPDRRPRWAVLMRVPARAVGCGTCGGSVRWDGVRVGVRRVSALLACAQCSGCAAVADPVCLALCTRLPRWPTGWAGAWYRRQLWCLLTPSLTQTLATVALVSVLLGRRAPWHYNSSCGQTRPDSSEHPQHPYLYLQQLLWWWWWCTLGTAALCAVTWPSCCCCCCLAAPSTLLTVCALTSSPCQGRCPAARQHTTVKYRRSHAAKWAGRGLNGACDRCGGLRMREQGRDSNPRSAG
jgi:hypothetical protein